MALPTLSTPTYELTVPSTKKKIKYRPFLVKEEKVLLLALESEDDKEIADAMKGLIKACVLTKGIDPDELATFDVEYIFLNIRGKSVGESIELNVTCPDDEETVVKVEVDIDDIKIQKTKGHSNIVKLTDTVSVVMKYPSMDLFIKQNLKSDTSQVDDVFEIASLCIDQVIDGEDVFESSSFSKKEVLAFLEEMDTQQFLKVQEFFETMPKLSHTIKVTNPKTKVKSDVVIEGLQSFFA